MKHSVRWKKTIQKELQTQWSEVQLLEIAPFISNTVFKCLLLIVTNTRNLVIAGATQLSQLIIIAPLD